MPFERDLEDFALGLEVLIEAAAPRCESRCRFNVSDAGSPKAAFGK
jgi:hypothetical protein